jgi:hypothetical protein
MKTPPAVTGRPRADSHAAYMTAPIVNGRMRRLTITPAERVASMGPRKPKSVMPLVCCRACVNDASTRPVTAADGMASITEMPANKRKWRRYMRNVSSSKSPISSGRSRSGVDTLTYFLLASVVKPLGKRCR